MYLLVLFPLTVLASAPSSISILDSQVTGCSVPVTAAPSSNNSQINIFYNTTNAIPDTLAWTDSINSTYTHCTVCTTVSWEGDVYGRIMALEYDFEHKLDPGMLESVATTMEMPEKPEMEKAWYETLYIYGGDPQGVGHVHVNLPNSTEALLLDYKRESETICSDTTWAVMARGWVKGAFGEVTKKGVFVQSMDIAWSET